MHWHYLAANRLRRPLLAFTLMVIAACSSEQRQECKQAEDCDPGYACIDGTCAEVCILDAGCSGENEICVNGTCRKASPGACADASSCDDANTCTTDLCDSANRCQHLPVAGACNDGDLCTADDTCVGTVCSGTAYTCDDDDPCTADTCTGNGGCAFQNICECGQAQDCDDNDVCTSDTCPNGNCVYTPLTGCCNGPADCGGATPYCRDHACVGCTIHDHCNDDEICTEDSCSASFTCVNTPISYCCSGVADCVGIAGRPYCHDNQCVACTGAEHCNDGNACTVDTCTVSFTCRNVNTCSCTVDGDCAGSSTPYCVDNACRECRIVAHCDDDNPCTTEACLSNNCVAASVTPAPACCTASAACAAEDPALPWCLNNTCVACRTTPDCADDDLYCNGLEICSSSTHTCGHAGDPCAALPARPACNESADRCDCTDLSCGALTCNAGTGLCEGCLDDLDCDDGVFCNGYEVCVAGGCTSLGYPCDAFSCNEVDRCAVTCSSEGCGFCKPTTHTCIGGPYAGSFCEIEDDCCGTSSCNDLDACTAGDICLAGDCSGTAKVCNTSPSTCRDNAGVCINGTCTYPRKVDGILCGTGGHCEAGVCVGSGSGDDCKWDPCDNHDDCCGNYSWCSLLESCCVAAPGEICP